MKLGRTTAPRVSRRGSRDAQRLRGAALLEFALVSLALYFLLAATFSLGRWMAVTQSAQDAARVAAREIALYPLPAEATFEEALLSPQPVYADFRQAVYDPGFLVVDLDALAPGTSLDQAFENMPVVNRALRPLMIRSVVDVGGESRRLLHMPGMITDLAPSPSGLTVVVPRVTARDPVTGQEKIEIAGVLEEVRPGAFSVLSEDRGLVGLRLNVPFQSAFFSAYFTGGEVNQPIEALGRKVRPFRRLVSPQAMFRREVFL